MQNKANHNVGEASPLRYHPTQSEGLSLFQLQNHGFRLLQKRPSGRDLALTSGGIYSILRPFITAGVAEWQTRRIQNPVRLTPGEGSSPSSGIVLL
jgi:hypothetical protein